MNEIALVSANFGGIDRLKPLPPHPGIDAFCYVDDKTRKRSSPEDIATWTKVLTPDYPRHDFSPRLRGRYFKHQIHRLDEVQKHRWLVWTDSSLLFHELQFLTDEVQKLSEAPPEKRLLVIPHPERSTISEEYEFISSEMKRGNKYLRKRYLNEKMPQQMEWFKLQGWNLHAPLWCGTFWIVENSERLSHCWDDWWNQNLRWGMMDQLSLPVLLEKYGFEPQALDVLLWKNQYFDWVSHSKAI